MITKEQKHTVGQLDKRVTFQYYGTTDDGMGGSIPDDNPTDVVETWASIKPLSGSELFSQGAIQSNITHRIKVRRRSDLVSKGYVRNTYDNNLQANYNGRKFNIQHALNLGEDDWYVVMTAVEEVGDET